MARILVVDDDVAVRETLKQLLEMEGHIVELGVDGVDGLKRAQALAYDLILLDRNMPLMSGIDVLRALRASPKSKTQRIYMLTSASVNKEVEEAFAAGANGYILKPIDFERFLAKIAAALKAA